MVQIPHSLVDFADALKALGDSQSDVTQLVTKWDELVNTTTPGTVKIILSNGTEHTVDNLAKIRQDLVEGLSLNNPTVNSVNFEGRYDSSGSIDATRHFGYALYAGVDGGANGPSEDPFDKYSNHKGFARLERNDLYTVCLANKAVCDFNLLELPRVMWLGYPDERNNDETISEYTFNVTAPPDAYKSQNFMVSQQYYGMVTLINSYQTRSGTRLGDVTVHIMYKLGKSPKTYVVPQDACITLLLWAHPNQDQVNVAKIGEGSVV